MRIPAGATVNGFFFLWRQPNGFPDRRIVALGQFSFFSFRIIRCVVEIFWRIASHSLPQFLGQPVTAWVERPPSPSAAHLNSLSIMSNPPARVFFYMERSRLSFYFFDNGHVSPPQCKYCGLLDVAALVAKAMLFSWADASFLFLST